MPLIGALRHNKQPVFPSLQIVQYAPRRQSGGRELNVLLVFLSTISRSDSVLVDAYRGEASRSLAMTWGGPIYRRSIVICGRRVDRHRHIQVTGVRGSGSVVGIGGGCGEIRWVYDIPERGSLGRIRSG